MQACFSELKFEWPRSDAHRTGVKYGIEFPEGRLTNLRFADDVILVAQQRSDIRKMLLDLRQTATKYGLKIHMGKTKVMTWNALVNGSSHVALGDDFVEILDECQAERYLGRSLCFADSQEAEFRDRVVVGWASFHQHKGELCNKFDRLAVHATLVDSVVTSTVLYGSAAWGLTQGLEKKLTTVRRRMLRYVFRIHRKRAEAGGELEDWVQYVQSSAHRVDELSLSLGMTGWIKAYRIQKWRFAGELARRTDSRWSQQAVKWKPNCGFGRAQGAPRTGWENQLVTFDGGNWMALALDVDTWTASEDIFATWIF